MECFSQALYRELGLPTSWPQDNLSESRQGVVRGMHIQSRKPQGKLIHCVRGLIQDVCIDLRPGITFGRTYEAVLSDHFEDRELFYVPAGFAHGFRALIDSSVYYKCTTPYHKESDGGVSPLDITWRDLPGLEMIVSPKDRQLPSLMDYLGGRA